MLRPVLQDHRAVPHQRRQETGIHQAGSCRSLAARPAPPLGRPEHPASSRAEHSPERAPHFPWMEQADGLRRRPVLFLPPRNPGGGWSPRSGWIDSGAARG